MLSSFHVSKVVAEAGLKCIGQISSAECGTLVTILYTIWNCGCG